MNHGSWSTKGKKMKRFEMFIGMNYKEDGISRSWQATTVELTVTTTLLDSNIDGFSAHWITGYWKGEKEATYHVIIFTDLPDNLLLNIAYVLKHALKQESVLATIDNAVYFI
jgi:acyl-CoA thioesterase